MDKERKGIHNTETESTTSPLLEIPRDKRGRIRWSILGRSDPEQLTTIIEAKAQEFLLAGNNLTRSDLRIAQMSDLEHAISRYYPGGLQALQKELNIPVNQRPKGYWNDQSTIESEAQKLMTDGSSLKRDELRAMGQSSLSRAIERNYPGGIHGLREKIGITVSRKPRNYWSDPEVIKKEADNFYHKHGNISASILDGNDRTDLKSAIGRYYPGGWRALRKELGIKDKQTKESSDSSLKAKNIQPKGNQSLKPPRIKWSKERVLDEAQKFYQDNGQLTQEELDARGRSDLIHAIARHYPGGLTALRIEVGLPIAKHPNGYWKNVELIKEKALSVYNLYTKISFDFLLTIGESSLGKAITDNYPGGWSQLRQDIGLEIISHPDGYWTPEVIKTEVQKFIEAEGDITQYLLSKRGKSNLIHAITRYYPGQLVQLKKDLEVNTKRKPVNFWTPETILEESKKFVETYGKLSNILMRKEEQSSLGNIIARKYPGRWKQLRIDLGIANSNSEIQSISPDEANKQLRRLLEEQT